MGQKRKHLLTWFMHHLFIIYDQRSTNFQNVHRSEKIHCPEHITNITDPPQSVWGDTQGQVKQRVVFALRLWSSHHDNGYTMHRVYHPNYLVMST